MRWTAILIGAAPALLLFPTAPAHAEPPAPEPPSLAQPTQTPPPPAPAPTPPESAPPPTPAPTPPEPATPEPESPEPPVLDPAPAPRPPPTLDALAHKDDWIVGLDASVGPLSGLSQDLVRASLHARFGYHFASGRLFLVPEGVFGFVEVVSKAEGITFHSEQVWLGAGGRAGLRLWRLEPAVFAHGYIWFAGAGAPAVDAGAALALRLTPSVALGVHVSATYGVDATSRQATFGTAGLHVDLMR